MGDGWDVVKEGSASAAPSQPDGWDVVERQPISWMDAAKSAVSNIPSSAAKFATDTIHPFIHPIDTAEAIKNLGAGVLQKMGAMEGDTYTKYADAAGQFLVDRYGSIEAAKRTLASDPVGLAGDLSLALMGGGGAVARLPGVVGEVGNAVKTAGRIVDPINQAATAVKGAAAVGSELVGGLALQTGGAPLRAAYRAGAEGGEAAKAFQENLRGSVPASEAVDAARTGLTNIVRERGRVYREEMAKLGLDNTVLNFDKVDDAITKATEVNRFKGVDLSPSTSQVRQDMTQAIQEWKALDPKTYHTAEGMDALKKKLGDIWEATEFGTPERKVAGDIYRSVRQTIVDQAPKYGKIMEGYEEASDLIKQMEKTLSLNPNASVDTSLRKLQSVLRNNVSTAYGHRAELADYLINAGAPHLIERLAGQALQPMLPRGLGRLGAEISLAMHPSAQALATLGVASPRIAGEGAYYAGKASPYAVPTARTSFQAGRLDTIKPDGSLDSLAGQQGAAANESQSPSPPIPGARRAPDGHFYIPDPERPGKFLRVDNRLH